MKPRMYLQQKLTLGVNRYSLFNVDSEGNKTDLIAFAQQKRLTRREKITFYSDEKKSKIMFTLRAEKVLDINGRYLIEDENAKLIGVFKKEGVKSLMNSTWSILDSNERPFMTVSESNKLLAFLRRFVELIPIIGDLLVLPLLFFKYNFELVSTDTQKQVGRFEKLSTVKDKYLLSVNDEYFDALDWRVYGALAVGLDALQSR